MRRLNHTLIICRDRYSFFLVLYPLGVAGETLSCYAALPYCKEKRPLDVTMPNAFNFTFNTHLVLIGIMLLYVPGRVSAAGRLR